MTTSAAGLSLVATRAHELLAQGASVLTVGSLLAALGADVRTVLDELADANLLRRSSHDWVCAPTTAATPDAQDWEEHARAAARHAKQQLEETTARLVAGYRAGSGDSRIAYGRHAIFREVCRVGLRTEHVRMMSPTFPASAPVLATGWIDQPVLRSQVEVAAASNLDDRRMRTLLQTVDEQRSAACRSFRRCR